MNSLDDLRAARPEVDILSDGDVERLWASVTGTVVRELRPAEVGSGVIVALDPAGRRTGRGWWAGIAAAAALVLVTVAGVAVWPRGEGALGPAATSTSPSAGSDGWQTIPHPPIEPRVDYAAVATDTGLFIWGGGHGADVPVDEDEWWFTDGAFMDSATQQWTRLPDGPLMTAHGEAAAAWDGREVLVVVTVPADGSLQAAAFDPRSFTWRSVPAPPVTSPDNVSLFGAPASGSQGRVVVVVGPTYFVWDAAAGTWTASERGTLGLPAQSIGGVDFRGSAVGGDRLAVLTWAPDAECQAALLVSELDAGTWSTVPLGIEGWAPTRVDALGGGAFVVAGLDGCGDAPSPHAVVVSPSDTGYDVREVAPPPARTWNPTDATTWTGEYAVMLDVHGRATAFDPATGTWRVGGVLPGGGARDEVAPGPLVLLGERIVVVSTAWERGDPGGGSTCCDADGSSWAFPLAALVPVGDIAPVATATTTTTTTTPPDAVRPPDVLRGTIEFVDFADLPSAAEELVDRYRAASFDVRDPASRADSMPPIDRTIVYAGVGAEAQARFVAMTLGGVTVLPMPPGPPPVDDPSSTWPDVLVAVGADVARGPVQLPDPTITEPARVAIVHTEGDDAAAQAIADELWVDGVEVVGRFMAARTFGETMVMPVRETLANTLVGAVLGIGGFDSWSPDLAAVTLPDDITAVVLVASPDS